MSGKLYTSLLTLVFLVGNLAAQTFDCDCSEPIREDLKKNHFETNISKIRQDLFNYYSTYQYNDNRKNLTGNFSSITRAITDGIPVLNKTSFAFNKNKSSVANLISTAITDNRFSSEELHQIITSALPERAWDSYDHCITQCVTLKKDFANGFRISVVQMNDDLAVVEAHYNALRSGDTLTVKEVKLSGGEIIGSTSFKDGLKLADGDRVYEHIGREKKKNIVITISVDIKTQSENGVLSIPAIETTGNPNSFPIGGIVSSTLTYEQFLSANQLKIPKVNSDIIWLPCDGRLLPRNVRLANIAGITHCPDLRGLYIRGANDMGFTVGWQNIPALNPTRKNPDNTVLSGFQDDTFKSHRHRILGRQMLPGGGAGGSVLFGSDNGPMKTDRPKPPHADGVFDPGGYTNLNGNVHETRPKSLTVNYFIRVN